MGDWRSGPHRKIESDIGVILTISVAIFVRPKLPRNMSTCPDRGIAGQVDMLVSTFKSGRGAKGRKEALRPLL
jgi:hypothetical protein